ncbi:transposase [Amycolatopsis thailandensis]|uniref:transposase n=1 Tax=Amycolatopsis thailandensis TaxID=589330 RepID=UPI00363251C4
MHFIRNALRFVSYGDCKKIVRAMNEICTATDLETAVFRLVEFDQQFCARNPGVIDGWRNAWN